MADATPDTIYLIAISSMIVAQDIAQTLAAQDERARVVILGSLEAVENQLQDLSPTSRLRAAILSTSPRHLAGTSLGAALTRQGCRVILLPEDDEDHHGLAPAVDWVILPRPFTEAMLRAALSG